MNVCLCGINENSQNKKKKRKSNVRLADKNDRFSRWLGAAAAAACRRNIIRYIGRYILTPPINPLRVVAQTVFLLALLRQILLGTIQIVLLFGLHFRFNY